MGTLSRQWKRGGRIAGRKQVNRAPLRKIVDYKERPYPLPALEVLECGHEVRPREDMIGPTNAARRRCRRCQMQRP